MIIFLGGTVNSNWRDYVIPRLNCGYFNPVVDIWDEKAKKIESLMKEECDLLLFVITPQMEGCFSIAEVVDASNKFPEKTILTVLGEDEATIWGGPMSSSLQAVMQLVEKNGAHVFTNLDGTIDFINTQE